MSSPTDLTIEASVMKGVQNALQRACLRSSLASSKLFLGKGLSTMFRWYGKSLYSFLDDSPSCLSFLYYERTAKSNRQVMQPNIRPNITCQPNLIRLQEDIMSDKVLGIDVHHHSKEEKQEDWWEFCPVCGCKLLNHKCRFVCSNPRCHFFMSCSEFDR